jgi:hypothetical protein
MDPSNISYGTSWKRCLMINPGKRLKMEWRVSISKSMRFVLRTHNLMVKTIKFSLHSYSRTTSLLAITDKNRCNSILVGMQETLELQIWIVLIGERGETLDGVYPSIKYLNREVRSLFILLVTEGPNNHYARKVKLIRGRTRMTRTCSLMMKAILIRKILTLIERIKNLTLKKKTIWI